MCHSKNRCATRTLAAACLLGSACGQASDAEPSPCIGLTNGWGHPDPSLTLEDLFPLDIGTSWSYRDVDELGNEEVLDKWILSCELRSFRNCFTNAMETAATVVQRTRDDDAGGVEDSGYDLEVDPTERDKQGLVRVYQEELVVGQPDRYDTYSPPLVRVIGPPYERCRVEEFVITRCRCDNSGCSRKTLRHRHEVLGERAIEVPFGSFRAVGIQRENLTNDEVKRHWYAPGIGRILEETIDAAGQAIASESLVSHTPGTEACF